MRRVARTATIVAAVVLLASAAAMVAYPAWWQSRSASTGQHIVHAVREHAARAGKARSVTCTAAVWPEVLRASSIGLEAPVEPGTAGSVLDVAVGSVSAIPPAPGTFAVLLAHDVSWFANLAHLRVGDSLTLLDPCGVEEHYAVVSAQVLRPGAPLVAPANGGVALVTCWPLDALWFTPDRYVVVASWVATTRAVPLVPPAAASIAVPAPPSLLAVGLGLSSWPTPLGTLSVSGLAPAGWTPEDTWHLLAAAQQLWVGLHLAAAEHRADWWSALAPGVVMPPAPLPAGGTVDVDLVLGPRPTVRVVDGATTVIGSEASGLLVATSA